MATKPKSKGKTAEAASPTTAEADPSFRPATSAMGEARFLEAGGSRTRYFDEGKGAPIVFVHGTHVGSPDGASSATTWALNFSVLRGRHNVISLDRLGQGYTDNPKSDADYTMHASVQHTIAFLEKLGKGPYHLVGHSRGGYVVSRLALERPDLARSVICASSGTLSPGIPRNHIVFKNPPEPLASRESIRWYLERYSVNRQIVTEAWLDDALAIATSEKTRAAVARMHDGGLEKNLFLPQLFKQRGETHRWLIERGMPCPTLVVWGLQDPAATIDNGMQLIELFMMRQRDTEVRIFNSCGHFVMREQAAGFNRMLDCWVGAHS